MSDPARSDPAPRILEVRPPEPPLSEAAAEAWIPRTCFKKGPPRRIGVELELLVGGPGPDALATHYPRHHYLHLIRTLDGGPSRLDGRLTLEPGGQVELSSRPGPNLPETVDTVHRDLTLLRRRALTCGARLIGSGLDPVRPPRRITDEPRYAAMERYLRPWGSGPAMMCSTASVQVNVEAQTPTGSLADRWELLHAIGPALVAAFANSPRRHGRSTGFQSTRQAVWQSLDPARTTAPTRRPGEDPATAYTRWALDAPLMLVRRDGPDWSAPRGLSFRGWLRHGRAAVPDRRPPTVDDLAYHLTTLFPPVRARGHLEVRYLDAQPGCWWIVPTAVLAAVLDDPRAADRARDACEPVGDRWLAAARSGVRDPDLARAAVAVLGTAVDSLRTDGATARFADQVEGYLQRWTLRGRSPADDPPGTAGGEYACGENAAPTSAELTRPPFDTAGGCDRDSGDAAAGMPGALRGEGIA
ncbi:ergothioneine biosynthesis glutamate--cysteine ligase EgtA [Nakamurella sp.]|uniref:ergothioneine biosynthesis glutamate--cysteine ligase EgtA n=1 Tax=Nakamurella sp. TaxID=1869182 RepID=UPI003782E99A